MVSPRTRMTNRMRPPSPRWQRRATRSLAEPWPGKLPQRAPSQKTRPKSSMSPPGPRWQREATRNLTEPRPNAVSHNAPSPKTRPSSSMPPKPAVAALSHALPDGAESERVTAAHAVAEDQAVDQQSRHRRRRQTPQSSWMNWILESTGNGCTTNRLPARHTPKHHLWQRKRRGQAHRNPRRVALLQSPLHSSSSGSSGRALLPNPSESSTSPPSPPRVRGSP
mmetsp:Transcript_87167/g.271104  ORF Transcript_87167/g.271104 Transcript_87167/m.271104 type:complete len:223 (+) Transcript_87167:96-764(+)